MVFVGGGGIGIALLLDAIADETGAVGDEAVDHGDIRAVDDAFEVVGEGHVLRHEDMGGDAGGGGVGGQGSGRVSSGGDSQVLEAIVLRHGHCHAEAAGFEGAGGIGALFLDVEAGVASGSNHGGPALAQGDGGYVGKDILVAPHAERGRALRGVAGGIVAVRGALEFGKVIADIKRAAVRGEGLGSVGGETDAGVAGGLEKGDRGHGSMLPKIALPWACVTQWGEAAETAEARDTLSGVWVR